MNLDPIDEGYTLKKHMTVSFITTDEEILLGLKKDKFGQGWWNGMGGKLEEGETYEVSAKREIEEESELSREHIVLSKKGLIDFYFTEDKKVLRVCVFHIDDYIGTPKETAEIGPWKWFKKEKLPVDQMWDADKHWIPKYFLKDALFKGKVYFDKDDKAINYEFETVDEL